MYKSLKINNIDVGMMKWGFMVWAIGLLSACASMHKTAAFGQPGNPLRGTWQGCEIHETDSVFYKITFFPGQRYRLAILSLPNLAYSEFSGSLTEVEGGLHLSSHPHWRLEVLSFPGEFPQAIRLYDSSHPRFALLLTPFAHEITEKSWALITLLNCDFDTLSLSTPHPWLLRFRTDNFEIHQLFPQPKRWGYYLLHLRGVAIYPIPDDTIGPSPFSEGWYQFQMNENRLTLRNPSGCKYLFERKLF